MLTSCATTRGLSAGQTSGLSLTVKTIPSAGRQRLSSPPRQTTCCRSRPNLPRPGNRLGVQPGVFPFVRTNSYTNISTERKQVRHAASRDQEDRATRTCRRPAPRWPTRTATAASRSIRVCAQNWYRCKGGPEPILGGNRASYGVGRTPVREAILKLSDEGLVEIFRNPASRFTNSACRAPEAIIIRWALEETTARSAAERATSSQILGLRSVLERQREASAAGDRGRFTRPMRHFTQLSPMSRDTPGI